MKENHHRPIGWPRNTVLTRINGGCRWLILGPFNEELGRGWAKTKTAANIAARKFREELKEKLLRQS